MELVTGATYCPAHRRRPLSPSSIAARVPGERERRRVAVAEWVAVHGWLCPGWMRSAHSSKDLTAAHVTAVSRGGGDGPLRVLCRSCNSRQALSDL